MLKSGNHRIKKVSQEMHFDDKPHPLVVNSPEKDCNPPLLLEEKYNRPIGNTRKRDFVAQVYRDTGFVCEV